MKSNHTKLLYSALISTLMLLSTTTYAVDSIAIQKPEAEIIAEFVACIKNFGDTRTYVQFIDAVIAKVKHNREYMIEYFKTNYPKLTVDGFITALESARKATSPTSAGAALYNYSQLLPKEITYSALLMGMTRRMRIG